MTSHVERTSRRSAAGAGLDTKRKKGPAHPPTEKERIEAARQEFLRRRNED
jgi:hypothetical protein